MRARLTFLGKGAVEIARSLEPDNIPGISLRAKNGELVIEFSAKRAGTLLATADDILMNIKVAEETLNSADESSN
jgi:tRNA threonylcarbamoyladenosine modification (KEOPS) complex  Pcc1 subunit